MNTLLDLDELADCFECGRHLAKDVKMVQLPDAARWHRMMSNDQLWPDAVHAVRAAFLDTTRRRRALINVASNQPGPLPVLLSPGNPDLSGKTLHPQDMTADMVVYRLDQDGIVKIEMKDWPVDRAAEQASERFEDAGGIGSVTV